MGRAAPRAREHFKASFLFHFRGSYRVLSRGELASQQISLVLNQSASELGSMGARGRARSALEHFEASFRFHFGGSYRVLS